MLLCAKNHLELNEITIEAIRFRRMSHTQVMSKWENPKKLIFTLSFAAISALPPRCISDEGWYIAAVCMQPLMSLFVHPPTPSWPTYTTTTCGLRWAIIIMLSVHKAIQLFSQYDLPSLAACSFELCEIPPCQISPKMGVSKLNGQQSHDWTNPTCLGLTWQQWVGRDQRDRNQWGEQISH